MSIPGKFQTSTKANDFPDLNARTARGGLRQDPHKIFSERPVRDTERNLLILRQEPLKSLAQELSDKHLQAL
jgi:hypothetical protein